jgi:SAM-dependent methyltransferase
MRKSKPLNKKVGLHNIIASNLIELYKTYLYVKMKKYFASFVNKFIYLKGTFGNRTFKLLDIGAGNNSTKIVFPNCKYYGVDLEKNYNNEVENFDLMEAFYEMDLTKLDFINIPNNYFDAINMVHVIEHLHNGDKVIEGLLPKLKKNGVIYIEYPGQKSTKLPSMYGTLNFYDDSSHVRVYSTSEIATILSDKGFVVLKKGTRRNIYFILSMPFRIITAFLQGKKLQGNIFWDILGFAEYVWAKKK